ncbi:apoptotic chromatin condensation inducer in the nucleus-like isoform X2 [Macadamia integrifolia]|uniref:apoptotic chromatin condensation inducer in the nucleus-like isoform X2 n=1 Tax=Macadamia integrifolia TaxID=60698 RepID=UPI001C4F9CB4|nr:apoptotic chromatin condensation inducer in the nucleus-like isoform X2 [Macadamia integrifolia]
MSSQYPILGNRPIDQWKVAELKEELKRRKLTVKGLKDDLIKRLDVAIRIEREALAKEEFNGFDCDTKEVDSEEAELKQIDTEIIADTMGGSENKTQATEVTEDGSENKIQAAEEDIKDSSENKSQVAEDTCGSEDKIQAADVDESVVYIDDYTPKDGSENKTQAAEDTKDGHESKPQAAEDICGSEDKVQSADADESVVCVDDTLPETSEGKARAEESTGNTDSVGVFDEPAVHAVSLETAVTVSQTVVTQSASSEQELQSNEIKTEIKTQDEDQKPLREDALLNIYDPNNQVSEVSPVLGSQVKYESISTDSVSIIEKNELKDNLNADNFHLELEVKPEMVQPSSSHVPPNGGNVHPLDNQEPRENQGSVEDIDDTNNPNMDFSKKNDSADGGSPEKLNLDRSSGDDSMEEDVLESKQIDSNHNSDEVRDRNELTEVHVVKEVCLVDAIMGDGFSSEKKEVPDDNENRHGVHAEKRKFEDQEAVGNSEPPKRQRRWNSEKLKVPELQTSNLTPSSTPKDASRSSFPKRNFSRSDSNVSEEAPKDRVVPPSQKPPTTSLRVDRFLRPFTLKAVQELLAKTGKVSSFWMDHIKTHCYVMYSSVAEAIETRNALYNLQWPPNGGRLLVAEFVDPQEVKMRAETPVQPQAPPVSTSPRTPAAPSNIQTQPPARQHGLRQQLPPPPPLPPPPSISDQPTAREKLPLPPPPPLLKKPEPLIVTLDDLFRKTKATPRIYYLPLSDEQVAAKLAARGRKANE